MLKRFGKKFRVFFCLLVLLKWGFWVLVDWCGEIVSRDCVDCVICVDVGIVCFDCVGMCC